MLAGPDQPLAGARVELVPVLSLYEAGRVRIATGGGPEPVAVAATGPDGRFRLAVPKPGSWKAVVRSPGRVPVQYGPLLWVEPGIELPAVTPPKSTAVPVAVREGTGRPVPEAWVLATDAEETLAVRRAGIWKIEPRAVRTGPDGTAALPGVEGRPLEVHVLAPGRGEEIRQGFTGGTISLKEASRLAVLDVESAGKPAAGVQVRTGGINWPFGHTDGQGEIRLPVLGTGAPRLRLVTSDGRQKVARLALDAGGTLRLSMAEPRVLPGRVVDAATGKGLSGAFLSPDSDPGAVLKTDPEGRYRLTLPGPGPLALEVRAPGYLPKKLTVSPGGAQAGRLPSLSLERAVSVEGAVLDAARQPLPGASVEAVPRSILGSRQLSPREPVADRTVTDAAGRFTLRRLRASETYEIRARRTGLLPAAQLVPVPAGGLSAKKRIQLQLHPSRPAQGKVVDAQGQPVAGARVVLRPAARPGFPALDPRAEPDLPEDDPAQGKSNEQGRFQVAACPAGEFDAKVTRAGFAPAYRRGIQAIGEASGSKGPVDLGTIALAPGARLAGRVVDTRSRPVPDAEIFLLSAPPRGFDVADSIRDRKPQVSSGPDGRFEITDLPKSVPHHLVARATGYLPAVLSSVRAPLKEPLVVRLQRGAPLAGRVVDEAGKPVEEARIELTWLAVLEVSPNRRPVGNPVTREEVTDAEGRFEIRDSPEGSVTLDVTAQGFVKLSEVEATVPWPDPSKELVLVLKRGASLSGRITTTAGEPLAQARVTARGNSGLSDAEGAYRVDGVLEGSQEIAVVHPDYPRLQRKVGIEPGENIQDFVFEPGTEVSGRTVDETGAPVAGARVRLRAADRWDQRQYEAVSGEDGRFSLRPVTAGEYRLQAEAGEQRSAEDRAPVQVAREAVTGLEVVLRAGAVLSGKVLGLSPEEMAKVEVRARKEGGRSLPARLSSDGSYEIRGLEAGDWVVQAVLWQGQRQTQARVPIAPDDREVTRDLEFGPRASLSGRVLFNGDPLPDAVLSVRGQRVVHQRTVHTDFAGGFRLDDLEPDRYWLGVSHPEQFVTHNQWIEFQGDQEVEIRLEDATLSGRVRDTGSGEPVQGARVSLRPATGPDFMVSGGTEPDGSFHLFRVPAAAYRMEVRANGYEPLDQEIQVAGGQDVAGLDIALKQAQGLRLQVRRASGRAPELVHLLALAPDGRPVLSVTQPPGAQGWIELAALPAGSWTLLLAGPGAATVSQTVTVPGEPVQVTLPDAARLHVRVADLTTSDLAAALTLSGADQSPLRTLAPGGRLQESWPLVGGKGTVEGVPAGVWTVRVQASDGRAWTATVTSAGSGEAMVSLP